MSIEMKSGTREWIQKLESKIDLLVNGNAKIQSDLSAIRVEVQKNAERARDVEERGIRAEERITHLENQFAEMVGGFKVTKIVGAILLGLMLIAEAVVITFTFFLK